MDDDARGFDLEVERGPGGPSYWDRITEWVVLVNEEKLCLKHL